jgi:hypothetical protein
MYDPVDLSMLERIQWAERAASFIKDGVDVAYCSGVSLGLKGTPAAAPIPIEMNEGIFRNSCCTCADAAMTGIHFYVSSEVQDVIENVAVNAPTMYYEPYLLPSDAGWVKFARPFVLEKVSYDIAAWVRLGDSIHLSWIGNREPEQFSFDYSTVSVEDKVSTAGLQWLFVGMHVLMQPVVRSQTTTVRQNVAGRAHKAGMRETTVRRVVLRRIYHGYGNPSNGISDREYNCQWIVRSHWRQQLYRSTGEVRPKLIAAYVKGPNDKPLKPLTANIFVAVR